MMIICNIYLILIVYILQGKNVNQEERTMVDHSKKSLAKTLYLHENMTLAEIAEKTGIKLNTLKYYVDKGSKTEPAWKDAKSAGKDNELLEVLKDDKGNISDIYSLGLSVVQRSLANMELRGEELSVQGVDRLLSALDKIDRWKRLEETKKEVDADNLELTQSEADITEHIFFKKGEEAS